MLVTIMTDASVCPTLHVGGFGYWIASGRGKEGGGAPFKTVTKDSYNGELKAVVCSLHIAIKRGFVCTGDTVLVQLDNINVVNILNRDFTPTREDIIPLWDAVLSMVNSYQLKLQSRHVKGHTTRTESRYKSNACCDDRAREAMIKARKQANRNKHSKKKKEST